MQKSFSQAASHQQPLAPAAVQTQVAQNAVPAPKTPPQQQQQRQPAVQGRTQEVAATSFADIVRQEVGKARPAQASLADVSMGDATTEPPQPQPSTEEQKKTIRAQLDTTMKVVAELEALATEDPDLAQLLATKKANADELKEQLRTLRPLADQAKVAVKARDAAVKAYEQVTEEVASLSELIALKQAQKEEAKKEVEQAQAEVDRITDLQKQDNRALPPSPPPAQRTRSPSPASAAEWAAGFQAALPPDMAASFQQWAAAQSPTQFQEYQLPPKPEPSQHVADDPYMLATQLATQAATAATPQLTQQSGHTPTQSQKTCSTTEAFILHEDDEDSDFDAQAPGQAVSDSELGFQLRGPPRPFRSRGPLRTATQKAARAAPYAKPETSNEQKEQNEEQVSPVPGQQA